MRRRRSRFALPCVLPLLGLGALGACGSSNVDQGVVTPDPPPANEGGRDVNGQADRAQPTDAAVDEPALDGEAGADAGPDPCAAPDLVGCFTFEGATLEDRSPAKLMPTVVQGLTSASAARGRGSRWGRPRSCASRLRRRSIFLR